MKFGSISAFIALLASLTAVLVLIRPSLLVRVLLKPLLPDVMFCGDGQRAQVGVTWA